MTVHDERGQQPVVPAKPARRPKAPPRIKVVHEKPWRFPGARFTRKRRFQMIKFFFAAVVAVAVYVALGVLFPVTGSVALIVTILSKLTPDLGAFTYKGLMAMTAGGFVARI